MSTNLQVIAAELPPGSCLDPSIKTYVGKTQVIWPTEFSLFVQGPNEPTVDQRDLIWVKTDALTNEAIGVFTWAGLYGAWIKRHWPGGTVPTNERRIWVGSLSALESFDGGEPGTVTETRGPFWEQDTDFTDKMLIGAGALAVGTDQTFGTTGTNYTRRGVYIIKPTGRVYDRA